jgi:chromosome segregation ATPase
MEEALRKYRLKYEESKREASKVRNDYNKWLSKKKRELEKALRKLEKAKPPKKVDETLLKLVEADRRTYISAFKRALEGIGDVEALGKRLPELAKIHVDYGKHVMILFEKEVYAVNSILKELDEGYREYLQEIQKRSLPKLEVEEKLEEVKTVNEKLGSINSEIESLLKEILLKREEIEKERQKPEVKRIDEEIKELAARKRKLEMEVRSNVSKIQKPIKRLRMGGLADRLARDSGVAIEKPREVVSLLKTLRPKFEGKPKKSAQWLVENLESSVEELKELERKIMELESQRERMLSRVKSLEEEIKTLERRVAELESERKKLEKLKARLEEEVREDVKILEAALGEKVEER